MIDIRKLKELVRLMVNNNLTEMDLRDNDDQVLIRRQGDHPPVVTHTSVASVPAPAAAPAPAAPAAAPANGAATATADDDLHAIESPMVGTLYSKPKPDEPDYVKVGDHVSPDTVVCLVEAMKIFNEIKAECSGVVKKVLVKNGESVEFGQPMFLIESD